MKKIIILTLCILIIFNCLLFTQTKKNQFGEKLFNYIDNKKEPGSAFALGMMFPAGGHLYANSKIAPLILITEISAVFCVINNIEKSNNLNKNNGYLVGFLFLKVVDSFSAGYEAKKYNNRLKKRLNLDFYIQK